MSSEVIHSLIKSLDSKLTDSLAELEETSRELQGILFSNPEFTSQELAPTLVKHIDIRRKSISYLKLMLKLRSFIKNENSFELNVEKRSGIRIDRISEKFMLSDFTPMYIRSNFGETMWDEEVQIPTYYKKYIDKQCEDLIRRDRFEACTILQTMIFSYN